MPVTRADVARLAAHTALAPRVFLDLLAPDEIDLSGEPESLAELCEGSRVAVLARPGGACVFLRTDSAGSESCSVHAERPLSCRTYPFDRPGRDRPGQSRTPLGLHPEALCPPETGHLTVLEPGSPSAPAWAELVILRDRELYEHAEWLADFNRRQHRRRSLGKPRRSAEEFLQLLGSGQPGSGRLGSGKIAENTLDPGQVRSTKEVEVDQQGVELMNRHARLESGSERRGLPVSSEDPLGEATEQRHHR